MVGPSRHMSPSHLSRSSGRWISCVYTFAEGRKFSSLDASSIALRIPIVATPAPHSATAALASSMRPWVQPTAPLRCSLRCSLSGRMQRPVMACVTKQVMRAEMRRAAL